MSDDWVNSPSSSKVLRWIALLFVAANIGFIVDYGELSKSATIAEVIAEHGKTLVPARFVDAMFAAILFAYLHAFLAAIWPRRHRIRVYDKLVVPLAVTSVLAASWVVAFRHREIALSVGLVAASVVVGGAMFVRVASMSPSRRSSWLRVPFSLYFGAMTVALLVAATHWFNAGTPLAEIGVLQKVVAAAFVAVVAASGAAVALRYSDFVYPAVIAAGVGAVFVLHHPLGRYFAVAALIVCIGMLVAAGLAAIAVAKQPRRGPTDTVSRRSTKAARKATEERWYLIEASTSIMRL